MVWIGVWLLCRVNRVGYTGSCLCFFAWLFSCLAVFAFDLLVLLWLGCFMHCLFAWNLDGCWLGCCCGICLCGLWSWLLCLLLLTGLVAFELGVGWFDLVAFCLVLVDVGVCC